MCSGGPMSCRERRAVEKQKSEGLVSSAVVASMTVLCVRFRLVGGQSMQAICLAAFDAVVEIHRGASMASARAWTRAYW